MFGNGEITSRFVFLLDEYCQLTGARQMEVLALIQESKEILGIDQEPIAEAVLEKLVEKARKRHGNDLQESC